MPEIVYKELPDSLLRRPLDYPSLPTEILITRGGNGCLTHAVLSLLELIAANVTVLDQTNGESAVDRAMQGKDVVLHAGLPRADATAEELKRFAKLSDAVLHAASACKVKAFIFASVASVVFNGTDVKGGTADLPIATPAQDAFSATLADMERNVAALNGSNGMATCIIRHHNLFGPGDPELLPTIAQCAREKRMQVVGGGDNVVDFSYSGNVAHAHLLAAQALVRERGGKLAGRAVVVTDGEPLPYRQFVDEALQGLGYGNKAPSVPYPVALCLALFFHLLSLLVGAVVPLRPRLSLARLRSLTRFQYYSTAAAAQLLGYAPVWTHAEGMAVTLHFAVAALRNPAAKVRPVGPFTAAEVARHTAPEDAWIIVDGRVFAISGYLDQHPGGDAILNNAGGDSTAGFRGAQHPAQAAEVLEEFYIGDLVDSIE